MRSGTAHSGDSQPQGKHDIEAKRTCSARTVVDQVAEGASTHIVIRVSRFDLSDRVCARRLFEKEIAIVAGPTAPRPVICTWLQSMSWYAGCERWQSHRLHAPAKPPGMPSVARKEQRLSLTSALCDAPVGRAGVNADGRESLP